MSFWELVNTFIIWKRVSWTLVKISQFVFCRFKNTWAKQKRNFSVNYPFLLYVLLCNRWSLPHTKGKWRYLSPLCHHHIVFITVKVSSSSVLACQGFPACLLCCVHPSTAHWSPDRSLRHCDTEMHTCCFYWPMTLSVENQSRNKKQRVKEGRERGKRDAC